ncbi:hypothetical protein EXZ61_03930 [Rhodoferax aquaticus]|uniref:Uncharacterized protein n=2 Tax=Rhodoferax aquaticus TaxID=2527691 RepID=A0A515EVG7_9BURK|nr:hypothetical protein EXZ61_03930 [Rhodoferax aquaticus]
MGKPKRLLVGLGSTPLASIQAQGLRPDIYDQYINRVGPDSWVSWNLPRGAYIGVVAKNADAMGAVPMFTLYQMATRGDGDLSGLSDPVFMRQYWDNVRLLFQQLRLYNKPALVNFEPDFWGYAQRKQADPTRLLVHVGVSNPDCGNLPSDMTGMARCLLQMARAQAPKAMVGFPPSGFPDLASTELAYMRHIGAGFADFAVMQTLDRDAGCFEALYTADNALCTRRSKVAYYWDETNLTSPNFNEHFAMARRYFEGLQLPLLWWQTPQGQPSTKQVGKAAPFRDNRTQYFLTHAAQMVAAGGFGVVFSPGHTSQTTIDSDGGQFKRLATQYLSQPAALP